MKQPMKLLALSAALAVCSVGTAQAGFLSKLMFWHHPQTVQPIHPFHPMPPHPMMQGALNQHPMGAAMHPGGLPGPVQGGLQAQSQVPSGVHLNTMQGGPVQPAQALAQQGAPGVPGPHGLPAGPGAPGVPGAAAAPAESVVAAPFAAHQPAPFGNNRFAPNAPNLGRQTAQGPLPGGARPGIEAAPAQGAQQDASPYPSPLSANPTQNAELDQLLSQIPVLEARAKVAKLQAEIDQDRAKSGSSGPSGPLGTLGSAGPGMQRPVHFRMRPTSGMSIVGLSSFNGHYTASLKSSSGATLVARAGEHLPNGWTVQSITDSGVVLTKGSNHQSLRY